MINILIIFFMYKDMGSIFLGVQAFQEKLMGILERYFIEWIW